MENIKEFEHLVEKIENLLSQKNDFLPIEKYEEFKPMIEEFVRNLEEFLNRNTQNIKTKELIYHYKGRLLDFMPEYNKNAEESLTKAVFPLHKVA